MLALLAALAACGGQPPKADSTTAPTPVPATAAPAAAPMVAAPMVAAPAPAAAESTPPAATPAPPPRADADSIFFALGASAVDEAGRHKLRAHAERLKENRRLSVTLVGHTDHLGSRSYNLAIAERRAAAVAEALVALGVYRSQIRRYGVGNEKGGAPYRNGECRRQKRRVDLVYPD